MGSNAVLRLTEIDGAGHSTVLCSIEVSAASTTIGRSSEMDICFGENDHSVSRNQFEVSFSGDTPKLKNTGRHPVLYKNGKKQLEAGAQIKIDSGMEASFRESKLRFDVEAPAVYCLKAKAAGGRAEFEIESGRKYTVGRSPECDITLESAGVSRRHCKLETGASGILNVHDLGSVNGVRLFSNGELQPEDSDLEVPPGVKFLIGDIECVFNQKQQAGGTKKRVALPVVILLLLLLVGAVSFFMLKPDGPPRPPQQSTSKEDLLWEKNIKRIQALVHDKASFDKKTKHFSKLAKDPKLGGLVPLCEQLGGYYSQCKTVEALNISLPKVYKQRKAEVGSSIRQLEFDFETTLSFRKLEEEISKLKALHTAVGAAAQRVGIEVPEPSGVLASAGALLDSANDFGEQAWRLFSIWTDLENSSFSASKFEKKEMVEAIDVMFPGEGLDAEVCSKIEAIIHYQQNASAAYEFLVAQVGVVVSNYTEIGLSEQLVPDLLDKKVLRDALGTPLPAFFDSAPPIVDVSGSLYSHLEAISTEWTNLGFLTHCVRWRADLEQRERVFPGVAEVVLLVDALCEKAAQKSAVDLEAGMEPYKEVVSRLGPSAELGLNDANKLVRVYALCHEYLHHEWFGTLQDERKNEAEAVGADCLKRVKEQLIKEIAEASGAQGAAEKGKYVKNAKNLLEVLDSRANRLPPAFEDEIKGYRNWVRFEVSKTEHE